MDGACASSRRRTSAPRARPRAPRAPGERSCARAGASLVVRHREHRARMTLGQLAPLDHPEDVVGELEQPQTVRDGRLRRADALGDVAQREVELVDEHGEGARLFDRRQLLARDVLDQPEQERVAIGRVPNERRQRLQVRLARRPPAPLARDELVATRGAWTQDDRLDDPLRPDRLGERAQSPRARIACAAASGSDGSGRSGRAPAPAPPAPPIRTSSPRPSPRLAALSVELWLSRPVISDGGTG